MIRFRTYVKPFLESGEYDSDFTEITKYVQSIGRISIDTDSSEYQIGVFRTSNFRLRLNNIEGLFSDVDQSESIFRYRRANSIIKITTEYYEDGPWCGVAEVDECYLSDEVEIFRGLLNDDSLLENAKDMFVDFICLGFESIFAEVETPFTSLSIGDLVSEAIYTCLNQVAITDLLTVSLSNITPDQDQALDAVAHFENSTVKEVLDELLNASNSVMYIQNSTIYVKPRTAGVSVAYSFYGQASQGNIENIMDIKNISNGVNRTFNFLNWADTTTNVADQDSLDLYGVKKREISYQSFTNTTKRLNILNSILSEFGNPKREMDLLADLNYGTLDLNLLDRVEIDFPVVLYQWENNPFPVCGLAVCGSSETTLPRGRWSLTINTQDNWKIIKKELDINKQTINFKLRLI